jgi:hypothetical protein
MERRRAALKRQAPTIAGRTQPDATSTTLRHLSAGSDRRDVVDRADVSDEAQQVGRGEFTRGF